MASASRMLYVGMTNDLRRRVLEHKTKQASAFTSKYNITQLVHYEATRNVQAALAREKEIKAWRREKKVALIEAGNAGWRDLSADWAEP
jgi:putative endonuclease